ncbi:MAG: HD-GYP domain-containing protein, partial [Candidatus Anammoxibacter sp.]
MKVTIEIDRLRLGMFVDLTNSWIENPFWQNRFVLRTQSQIDKIVEAGIKKIVIDTQKSTSDVGGHRSKEEASRKQKNLQKSKQEQSISDDSELGTPKSLQDDIASILNDRDVPAGAKAKAVYNYAYKLIEVVFKITSNDVIIKTKNELSNIVDIIVGDIETSNALFKINSPECDYVAHSVNVGLKSVLLANAFLPKSMIRDIPRLAGGFFLHDIGYTKIDREILNKRGKLTEEEVEQIKKHPFEGYKILNNMRQMDPNVLTIPMQHHERTNGRGYPAQLKGIKIHIFAQICSFADMYDGLTSERFYKKQNSPVEALNIMKKEMHFSPDMFKE